MRALLTLLVLASFACAEACSQDARGDAGPPEPERAESEALLEVQPDQGSLFHILPFSGGRRVLVVARYERVFVFELGGREPLAAQQYVGKAIGASVRGDEIFLARDSGEVAIWDASLSKPLFRYEFGKNARIAVLSGDGRFAAVDGAVVARDTGARLGPEPAHAVTTGVAYAAGRFLSSGFWDGTLALRSLPGGALQVWTAAGGLRSSALSADGARVAATTADFSLLLWEASAIPGAGEPRAVAPLARTSLGSQEAELTFAPDGARLVARLFSGEVRVYGVPQLRQERVLSAPSPIRSLAWIDAGRIALGTEDGSVLVQGLDAEAPAQRIEAASAPIVALDFDAESQLLGVGSERGHVRVYRIGPAS